MYVSLFKRRYKDARWHFKIKKNVYWIRLCYAKKTVAHSASSEQIESSASPGTLKENAACSWIRDNNNSIIWNQCAWQSHWAADISFVISADFEPSTQLMAGQEVTFCWVACIHDASSSEISSTAQEYFRCVAIFLYSFYLTWR